MAPLYEIARKMLGYQFPKMGPAANKMFFRAIPRKFKAEIFPGIFVWLDSQDVTQRTTYWQGIRFEYPTVKIISDWVTLSITHFFDIGANYGFFSYLILSRFKHVRVHAFEPNHDAFEILRQTKEANRLDNLHPHCIGLSDESGELFLGAGTYDTGISTFADHPEIPRKSDEPTQIESFDEWREKEGIPLPESPAWVAKIDVEGYDLKVLKGMSKALASRAFAGLSVEVCENTLAMTGTKPEEIPLFMESAGYRQLYPPGKWRTNGNGFYVPR